MTITGKTGEFTATSTVKELLDEAVTLEFERIIPANDPIEWTVFVPENYDSMTEYGIVVFISANDSGKIPPDWKAIMTRRKLIWISANRSGNRVATSLRMTYALLASAFLFQNYRIDHERIYASGFSGGGRVASLLATAYANLFKGAIYNCGANFWKDKKPRNYQEIRENHYVFVTGTDDFNLADTKRVYRAYKKAGVKNVKLIVVSSMGHQNPSMVHYEEAVDFLDSRQSP